MIIKEIPIAEIASLLEEYVVEVDSPDGWVEVSEFVDKGEWEEYVLHIQDKEIRVNENHLFETKDGWKYAKDLDNKNDEFLCDDNEYHFGVVKQTNNLIPIVDIQVEHENHRYYTDGVSSHNTGVGKSLTMCDFAASNLSMGKNVLYITMEMAEEKIAERIDANLFDVDISKIVDLSHDSFTSHVNKIASKTNGKLIVKQYPTASAHVGHFRALLMELKQKKNFVPDIIYIDYLNICASSRINASSNMGTYGFIKSIAEEIRGLAVEFNLAIVSATQSVRGAQLASDVEITDVSESFGLAHTVDLLLSLISTEALEKMSQIIVKQLKNRYNDVSKNKRFAVGIDKSKMRLYDLEDPLANISVDSTQSVSNVVSTPFSSSQTKRKEYTGFKV